MAILNSRHRILAIYGHPKAELGNLIEDLEPPTQVMGEVRGVISMSQACYKHVTSML